MGYEYKPLPKSKGKKNTLNNILNKLNDRRVIIAAAVVLVAVFVFTSISSVTGFVAQQQAEQMQLQNELDLLEQQREQCNEELATTLESLSNCKGSLDSANAELAATKSEFDSVKSALNICQADLNAMSVIIQQLNASLVSCENEKALLQEKLNQLQASYDKLALNAAKAICCRPGDTSSQWGISGDSIVCRGDKTVTC